MNKILKLAKKFEKYALSIGADVIRPQITEAIHTSLRNAAGQKQYGIMPFIKMIGEDGVDLSFDVLRDDGTFFPTITVSNIEVPQQPLSVAEKYQPLAIQIKNFLEKYPEIYQTQKDGQDVVYDNFKIHLTYSWKDLPEYAQK